MSVSRTTFAALLALLFTLPVSASAAENGSRAWLLQQPLTPLLGGSGTVNEAGIESFRQIVTNAGFPNRARFAFGKIQFNTEWDPAPGQVPANDGLGPVFNAVACASCHINNGRGRPPLNRDEAFESALVRLSTPGENAYGGPLPLAAYGDQLQHRSIAGVAAEGRVTIEYAEQSGQLGDGTRFVLREPRLVFSDMAFGSLPEDTLSSLRIANPVIGLGLLEAVPESTLVALADPDDSNGDGISGRINRVWSPSAQRMLTGRFGWKANVATIDDQNAGAALGDMGITTPIHPDNNCTPAQTECIKATQAHADEIEFQKDFFEQLGLYVRLIGVPTQRNADDRGVIAGEALFRAIGCAQCHMPTLETGAETRFTELADKRIHPFTDLLLHDMGPGLADSRPDFAANGNEWRTAALWGIGLASTATDEVFYLHDGRARTITEAILWHGGEAQAARDGFAALPAGQRELLLQFLNSL